MDVFVCTHAYVHLYIDACIRENGLHLMYTRFVVSCLYIDGYICMHTCVCASINRCMYTRFVVSCLYINGYICMHTCVCASINRCMCIGKSSSPHVHQMWYVTYTHCMCACVCMHTSISNIRPRPTRGQFVNEA